MNSAPSPYLHVVDHRGNAIPRAALASEYEGAASGRRMNTWGLSSAGPNAALYGSLSTLRSRSRELIRNHPLMDGGVDTFVANLIGSGIAPRWKTKDKDLKEFLLELWNDWIDECDFYGLGDFYGLESLISRGLIDAGETLYRFVNLPSSPDMTVPLQIQVLEADHLEASYNSIAPNGNEIRMGIEVDKSGRRTAYWIFREHPGEYYLLGPNATERWRIPAADLGHVFRPLRAGQMRGRPWLSSIIVKLHELDQYEDAELVRKKTAAMFGGFIVDSQVNPWPGGMGGVMGRPVEKDENSNDVVALEPGTFPCLPDGKDVKFSNPVDVGQTYEVWIKQQLREIARGWGITYEQLTGDLTGVNYSSIRAGLLEFRRQCAILQQQTIAFQFCRPVLARWTDTAALSGALKIDVREYLKRRREFLRVLWYPDGWPWVDPLKDQLADQLAVRNGFKSRAKVVAERGEDIENVDREIAEDNARADELGLVLDSDPRHTTSSGSMQQAIKDTVTGLQEDGKRG